MEVLKVKKLKSRVEQFRKIKGMSRLALTKEIGCSYPSMIRYEKGEAMPSKTYLVRLCAFFYCQPGDLFFVD